MSPLRLHIALDIFLQVLMLFFFAQYLPDGGSSFWPWLSYCALSIFILQLALAFVSVKIQQIELRKQFLSVAGKVFLLFLIVLGFAYVLGYALLTTPIGIAFGSYLLYYSFSALRYLGLLVLPFVLWYYVLSVRGIVQATTKVL